jgi:hypothetical protein
MTRRKIQLTALGSAFAQDPGRRFLEEAGSAIECCYLAAYLELIVLESHLELCFQVLSDPSKEASYLRQESVQNTLHHTYGDRDNTIWEHSMQV